MNLFGRLITEAKTNKQTKKTHVEKMKNNNVLSMTLYESDLKRFKRHRHAEGNGSGRMSVRGYFCRRCLHRKQGEQYASFPCCPFVEGRRGWRPRLVPCLLVRLGDDFSFCYCFWSELLVQYVALWAVISHPAAHFP